MKKYIRTKDGRIAEIKDNMIVKQGDVLRLVYKDKPYLCVINGDDEIIKQADTIEELCDGFVIVTGTKNKSYMIEEIYEVACNEVEFAVDNYIEVYLYGAIWTDGGLKYVAKMNKDRELELTW